MKTIEMKLFLILTFCVYSVCAGIISDNLKPLTDEIIKAINDLNTTWKAGNNFNGSTSINKLIAPRNETYFSNFKPSDNMLSTLPAYFDARDAWPNCTSIGRIYDQKKGYPSWMYAAVGQIVDRLCIKTGLQIDVETTVKHLMKSDLASINASNSAKIGQAFNYWSKKGIFTVESDEDSSCLPNPVKCQSNGVKIHKYFKLTAEKLSSTGQFMYEIMNNGPITSYLEVYTDFFSYKSGVYIRSSSKSLGIHNVKLIGSGKFEGISYYLATNSWGTEWGDKGFFKIQLGTAQFGNVPEAISISIVPTDIESAIPSFSEKQLFYLI